MSIFRTRNTSHPVAESPSLLFRDLRRSPEMKFLWDHQGKLLDEYHKKHLNMPDVALELPTGSGKTLVGLLIAEYKRKADNVRVAYLCPTRQLCNQVNNHAARYGINCSLLVGPQRDYDPKAFTNYQRGEAIGITTYSGIFNSNPKISDAQVIICDDAHAADNYIPRLWSLHVKRHEMPEFFQALVEFFGDAIPSDVHRALRLSEGKWDQTLVDLIPAPKYAARLEALSELLDVHCNETKLIHPWHMLSGRLEACNIYISPSGILIKPLIPLSQTHAPFASATQRVFMSATLGEGGELERITGIPNIARLPIPSGWDKRGTGRRLILFPSLLSAADGPKEFVDELMYDPSRTLVLVTEDRLVKGFDQYEDKVEIFHAEDIEESLDDFTSTPGPAALVLANRYDGIDLPGDSCRKEILLGLPASTDLQEKFLYRRLSATSQLRDRIRTRITQGIGRCTRDENDYALVVLVGNDILKWCSTETNVQGMHPELQAEISFGLDNSTDRVLKDFSQLASAFLEQGEDWAAANEVIIVQRNSRTKRRDSVTDALERSMKHEIGFVYSMWSHDFERAYEQATAATEALSGNELKPYRAFWHYEGAVAAYHVWRRSNSDQWRKYFNDHVTRAVAITSGLQWLAGLRTADAPPIDETNKPSVNLTVIVDLLERWQIVGPRFERNLNAARENIFSDSAKRFGEGLRALGQMLGCESKLWADDGAPDGLWVLVDNKAIVFEAKTEETPTNSVALKGVRQALTHGEWLRSSNEIPEETNVFTDFITHQSTIKIEAQKVAEDLRYITVQEMRDLFTRAATLINSVRTRARTMSDENLRELIDQMYREANLTHDDLLRLLLARELRNLPTAG